MGRLEGKVALITGAARGQGRSHAVRLAEEGADIIAVDICCQLDEVEYPMATPDDLAETVKLVEGQGRRIIARQADVRQKAEMEAVVEESISAFGAIDVVLANAGIMPTTNEVAHLDSAWYAAIDVMLTGVHITIQAVLPRMVEAGRGGSIVITSSVGGLKGPTKTLGLATHGFLGYCAAKHGVVGLMRCYANALAPYSIRVNTVHPTGVNSPMVLNEAFAKWVGTYPEMGDALQNAMPVPMVECEDISNAIVWLCGDEARYVTGVTLPVDAGLMVR
jgi:SDR family mycofactocin-dependent oxidoreductase